MSSFVNYLSWRTIDFSFVLTYSTSLTASLNLLNSNTSPSLAISKTTKNNTGSTTLTIQSQTITKVSATTKEIKYKTNISRDSSYNKLNLIITYDFDVGTNKGKSEAKTLSTLSSTQNIFHIETLVTEGSTN